jgi:hypothetical protein
MTIDFEFYKDGAIGDMVYRNASGLYVPVGLSKATGKVPTIQADGTVGWETPAAGAGAFSTWNPNVPPGSANALDVEFASDTTISAWPAGWTAQPQGDFQNPLFPSSEKGRFSSWHNAAGWKGRYATCPAAGTDFSLAAHLAVQAVPVQFSLFGIGLGTATNAASGSYCAFYAGQHNSFSTVAPGLGMEVGGAITVNWGQQPATARGVVMYIRRVSTTYTCGWTIDGQRGPESTFTPGFTPAYMHLLMYSDRSSVAMHEYFWVRHLSGSGAGARQSWGDEVLL